MSDKTKSDVAEGEWQGKRGSIAYAKQESKRLRAKGRIADSHMVLVSPYYSAVKRNPLLAPWRLWLAIWHSVLTLAFDEREYRSLYDRPVSQLNVLAAPLSRMPKFFERLLVLADGCIVAALANYHPDNQLGRVVPHDTALNLVLLARIKMRLGAEAISAASYFDQALGLEEKIRNEEDGKMALRQLCRVKADAGAFFFDHFKDEESRERGELLLIEAWVLSCETQTPDQEQKILNMMSRRSISASVAS